MTNLAGMPPLGLKHAKERGTAKERRFYAWLHSEGQCCLTGLMDFQIAHTGRLQHGKGMARKARLNTCLPLQWQLHIEEERSREAFWEKAGFPGDTRFDWSERLFDLFEKQEDPTSLLMDMRDRANLLFLGDILRREK